jgi:hypothetical protein
MHGRSRANESSRGRCDRRPYHDAVQNQQVVFLMKYEEKQLATESEELILYTFWQEITEALVSNRSTK